MRFQLSFLCFFLSQISLGQTSGEVPRLNLGIILPLSGEQALFGKEAQRGIDLAIELWKQRNENKNLRVQSFTADSGSLLHNVKIEADRLLHKERTQILIGGLTSPELEQLSLEVAEAKASLMVPIANDLQRSERSKPASMTYFATNLLNQSRLLGVFAGQKRNSGLAIIKDDTFSTSQFLDEFKHIFAINGGKVLVEELFDPEKSDSQSMIQRFLDLKVTSVLMMFPVDKAIAFLKQCKKECQQINFLGDELWDSPAIQVEVQKTGVQFFHLASFAVDDPAPETMGFVSVFESKYKRKPGGIAALSFDATNFALTSFEQNPTSYRDQNSQKFRFISEFRGVSGVLSSSEPLVAKRKTGIIKRIDRDGVHFEQRVIP